MVMKRCVAELDLSKKALRKIVTKKGKRRKNFASNLYKFPHKIHSNNTFTQRHAQRNHIDTIPLIQGNDTAAKQHTFEGKKVFIIIIDSMSSSASNTANTTTKAFDVLVKLLLIGDSGVGKSCLLLRYSDDKFTTSFITTIGIDFKIKTIRLDQKKVKMQIWDTAGQERFRTITAAYYRGAHGVLLVYDVTDERSFENVRNWMRNIEAHASEGAKVCLIGNKCDCEDSQRKVTKEKGMELAKEFGVPFFETSAKSGLRVEEAFSAMARRCVGESNNSNNGGGGTVRLKETAKGGNKSSCC